MRLQPNACSRPIRPNHFESNKPNNTNVIIQLTRIFSIENRQMQCFVDNFVVFVGRLVAVLRRSHGDRLLHDKTGKMQPIAAGKSRLREKCIEAEVCALTEFTGIACNGSVRSTDCTFGSYDLAHNQNLPPPGYSNGKINLTMCLVIRA